MKKILYFSFLVLLSGISFAQKDILVNWECNMEIEILSGRYNTADTVAARGTFNGWGRNDLVPSTLDPDIYVSEVQDTVLQASVGDTILSYKFFYTPDTWEGGNDKPYILTQSDYDNGEATISRPFNDGTLSTVTNQPTDVLFQVDCNGAISAVNSQPFPVINTVHIAGGTQPLQWPSLGWPSSEIDKMIALYDDGTNGDPTANDKVFSGIVTFPAYTTFEVQYKFSINFGDSVNNGGGNDNENAIGTNHVINLFSSAAYCVTLDTFGVMGAKEFVTGVENNNNVLPTTYTLGQNYPNPFNPSTKINFSVPKEGLVSIKVYNSIGQEIATLVNENKSAGNYTVNFDAARVSSGIYFYKIVAGNFTATKKMILLK